METALSILRRLIGGRPIFTADREHIHHKLLELGWSHRQVVIILYAVSALFAMLSLFLLWPTGSTLGLVLAVIGTGIWLGVQHLNYLEFGELRRVAQRTIEQRYIVINNLAVRRAVEELKVASSFEQVRNILVAAFEGSDFDAFELHTTSPLRGPALWNEPGLFDSELRFHRGGTEPRMRTTKRRLRWSRFPHMAALSTPPAWKLTLELVTTSNQPRGQFVVSRFYSGRDLQLDVNLLTSQFPGVLADALDRVLAAPEVLIPIRQDEIASLAANL